MAEQTPSFTPYVPSDTALAASSLLDESTALSVDAAALAGQLSDKTRQTITQHMASINSYYSNLIERNNTRPHEIRQAQAAISPAIQSSEIYSLNQSHTFMFRTGLLSKTSVWRSYTHLSLFKLFISMIRLFTDTALKAAGMRSSGYGV
jgi:hypothetical protein